MDNQYFEHITKQGDRWDLLAHQYYGNAHHYMPIKDANPTVRNVTILEGNLTLKIPILEQETVNQDLLPPWKRR